MHCPWQAPAWTAHDIAGLRPSGTLRLGAPDSGTCTLSLPTLVGSTGAQVVKDVGEDAPLPWLAGFVGTQHVQVALVSELVWAHGVGLTKGSVLWTVMGICAF